MTEFLDVVDESDQVIGQAARTEVHARGLWHRGVHVFLFAPDGKLLVQKRSADRRQYASLWDGSVSEHVTAGETYLDAARRGIREELGASVLNLEPVLTFRMVYGPDDNEISTLFHAAADLSDVRFDLEEIQAIEWRDGDELTQQMKNEPTLFCGWFMEILGWYLEGKAGEMAVLQEHTRKRLAALDKAEKSKGETRPRRGQSQR